jgi:hypothetical protein
MKIAIRCWFLLSSLFSTTVFGQSVDSIINYYGANYPQEKIHIQFDKELYVPGETIWFKAYIFEENLPSARSTNFYAALYDEDGNRLQDHISPIFNSVTDGHFIIPDSLASKQLICRAYTSWMLNFDSSFLFTKAIKLINTNAKDNVDGSPKKVTLQFFPEGGDMIEGTRNTIAFKANYANGLPYEIDALIKKQETGEVIIPIRSEHNGMGRFDLEINSNEKFYAEWRDHSGTVQRTNLPKPKVAGVSLKLVQQKDKLLFNIANKLPNDSLHVIMYMYQQVFYIKHLSVSADIPFTRMVPINTLPSGTMQVTVFDANWQPVAERVAFINNSNYSLPATIINKETTNQSRAKNIIEIELTDTMPANMSLSITDAEFNIEKANSNIVTAMLLGGDLKGYIHDPSYYFTNNTDSLLKARLDLVMLTHGWRRYNWNTIISRSQPVINYPGDNYLSVHGQVGSDIVSKVSADEVVNLIIKTKDSTNMFYAVRPDSTGLLKQTGLVFYDTARISFSFNKNKIWNAKLAFSSYNYTHRLPYFLNSSNSYMVPDSMGYVRFNQSASLFSYYNNSKVIRVEKEKTLQTVVVKNDRGNWKNDPLYLMDKRYANGVFGSTGGVGIDVMNDEMAPAKIDVYNFLIGKIPGLGIDYTDPRSNKILKYLRPLIFFIDDTEVDNQEVEKLEIHNIAYIKLIERHGGRPGFPAAISFYSKKGEDLIDRRPKATDMRMVKVAGYSAIKEFYSPDYSESNTTLGTDARITLLWVPYILTNAKTLKVPVSFYNNDFTKKMRVVLEGINEEGKMIHIEKFIE